MAALVTNNASATLASGIISSATSIALTAGQGALFPSPAGSDYFYATLVDSSNNIEIVKCTARSTDTLTVTRAQEGTTARAYSAGDRLELRPTAALFNEKAPLASPTFTGTVTAANLTVTGNTILGSAPTNTLTIAPNAVTWSGNPTHSGNHTFSGTITNTALTGGTINNASVGASTPSTGLFTTLGASGLITASAGVVASGYTIGPGGVTALEMGVSAGNGAINTINRTGLVWAPLTINSTLTITNGTGVSVTGTIAATGKISGPASALAAASFNAPHGIAPTAPSDGDIWTTTLGMFVRISGVTKSVNLT